MKASFRNQTFGRSMVEMLGVLAIIGILSIGGLVAYRWALTRYQFNQLLDFINRLDLGVYENCIMSDTCKMKGWSNGGAQENRRLFCASVGQDMCDETDSVYVPYVHIKKSSWTSAVYKGTTKTEVTYYFYLPPAICTVFVQHDFAYIHNIYIDNSTDRIFPEGTNGQFTEAQKKTLIDKCNTDSNRFPIVSLTRLLLNK